MMLPRVAFDPVMLQTFDITSSGEKPRKLPLLVRLVKRILNRAFSPWSKVFRPIGSPRQAL